MSHSNWQLDDRFARWKSDAFSAQLDFASVVDGLHRLAGGDIAVGFAGARLLGIEIPSLASGGAVLPTEEHARASDLAVVYAPTAAWPVRVDVLWRVPVGCDERGASAAVELIVSVRTELLECRPALSVQTSLAADEVLRLADASSRQYRPLTASRRPQLSPAEGPGCLLFRRAGRPVSYAEMVHPSDFHHDELDSETDQRPAIRIRHRLFSQRLEKGVILRARIRGVFCPRDTDEATVAATYCDFAAADPPLDV